MKCGKKVKNSFYKLEAFEEHWHFPHITVTSQRTTTEPIHFFKNIL